jgi:two-component system sensor histidine kinase YesM
MSSDDSLTTIGAEIASLNDYMSLMQKRYANRLDFQVACDDAMRDWRIPRFLIQPLLENAILHGLREQINDDNERAELRLAFEPNGTRLAITVGDNGVGMSREQVVQLLAELPDRDSDHIGVKNIHDRLVLAYGPPCGLSIRSKPDHGTDITITVPIQQGLGDDL